MDDKIKKELYAEVLETLIKHLRKQKLCLTSMILIKMEALISTNLRYS